MMYCKYLCTLRWNSMGNSFFLRKFFTCSIFYLQIKIHTYSNSATILCLRSKTELM